MLLLAAIPLMTSQLLAAAAPAPAAPDAADLGRRALSALASALSDPDFEVRADAAIAFGRVGNPAAIKLLAKALKDRNAHVRVEAAYSLHLLGDEEGVPVMERVVRQSSAAAAGELSPREELKLLARSKSRVRAIQRLSEIGGEQVVALFEKTLKDPSGEVRDATGIALAKLGLDEFSAPFMNALQDPDENVRAAAVRALAGVGRGDAVDAVAAAAGDRSVLVRQEVMRALGHFSSPETALILAKGAKDPDKRVQASALASLARIPDGGTAALLRDVLKTATAPEIELKAMAGLARRGDRVDLAVADDALKQKDPDLKMLALDALEAEADDASTALLKRTLETDPDARVRVEAASILVRRLQRKAGAP